VFMDQQQDLVLKLQNHEVPIFERHSAETNEDSIHVYKFRYGTHPGVEGGLLPLKRDRKEKKVIEVRSEESLNRLCDNYLDSMTASDPISPVLLQSTLRDQVGNALLYMKEYLHTENRVSALRKLWNGKYEQEGDDNDHDNGNSNGNNNSKPNCDDDNNDRSHIMTGENTKMPELNEDDFVVVGTKRKKACSNNSNNNNSNVNEQPILHDYDDDDGTVTKRVVRENDENNVTVKEMVREELEKATEGAKVHREMARNTSQIATQLFRGMSSSSSFFLPRRFSYFLSSFCSLFFVAADEMVKSLESRLEDLVKKQEEGGV